MKFLTMALCLLFVVEVVLEEGLSSSSGFKGMSQLINCRVLTPLVSTMWSMKAPANPALFISIRTDSLLHTFQKNLQELLRFCMTIRLTVICHVLLVCFGSLERERVVKV